MRSDRDPRTRSFLLFLILAACFSLSPAFPATDPAAAAAEMIRSETASPVTIIEQVIEEMEERFAPLDAACDFRAPFALTYLITTQAVLEALRQDVFADPEWLSRLDRTFADLYFKAFDDDAQGEGVPRPWRYAFERAEQQANTVLQDALLGINAHINYDLPFALYAVGLSREGDSHQPDYRRVDQILEATAVPLIRELARFYDPLLHLLRPFGREVSELVAALFASWREEAWQNAVRLEGARSEEDFQNIRAEMETRALARAHQIASPESRHDPRGRLLYCRLRH